MTQFILRRLRLGKTSTHGIRDWLRENARIDLPVVRNDRPIPNNADTVFRWGCTSNIPGRPTIINQSRAIHWVNNKLRSRQHFADVDLAPPTVTHSQRLGELRYPVVVRPEHHAQGRRLHLCNNEREARHWANRYGAFYASEYVPKRAEYRVFVGSGRAVWVAEKTPGNRNEVAWNVARGGRFDNVRWGDWPLDVVDLAIQCFNETELDFGGVDVMVGENGRPYCLEINSAPSQTSPYRQSCVAKYFKHILDHGKDRIPVARQGKARRYIHPCLDEGAHVG